MLLQLEEVALGEGADGGCQPGQEQHYLRPLGLGAVSDGRQDGRETVQRDDDHDEASEVAADDPEEDGEATGDVVRQPGDGIGPADLQRDLNQNHLHRRLRLRF